MCISAVLGVLSEQGMLQSHPYMVARPIIDLPAQVGIGRFDIILQE